jgi:drug/metabolite transporter (DMT)-like permease
MKSPRHGLALCVLSACGFGAMAIFAKEAYATGVTVVALLSLRFLLAAAPPGGAAAVEPAVTVGLATTFYGEALGPGQLAGGVLVLAAAVVLQLRAGSVAGDEPAPRPAPAAPARALAYDTA